MEDIKTTKKRAKKSATYINDLLDKIMPVIRDAYMKGYDDALEYVVNQSYENIKKS